MKAITLYQPYASLVAYGLKSIETREHARFRSLAGATIAIHAGKRRVYVSAFRLERGYRPDSGRLQAAWEQSFAVRGAIVAIAHIRAARWLQARDSQAALYPAGGRFGLILDKIRRFCEPQPATGHQGIWTWEPPENWKELLAK